MTPEEVAESYATRTQPSSDGGQVDDADDASAATGDPDASST